MKVNKISQASAQSAAITTTVKRPYNKSERAKVPAVLPSVGDAIAFLTETDAFNALGAAMIAVFGVTVDGRPVIAPVSALTYHDKRGRVGTEFGTVGTPAKSRIGTGEAYFTTEDGSEALPTQVDVLGMPWNASESALVTVWDHYYLISADGECESIPVALVVKADGSQGSTFVSAGGGFRDDDGETWNVNTSILPRQNGSVRVGVKVDQRGTARVETDESTRAYAAWAYGPDAMRLSHSEALEQAYAQA